MPHPEPDRSDAQLVGDSLVGDRTAFGILVTRHRAAVNRFQEGVFYGTLHVQTADDGPREINCRPSDAINLALRTDAPILVAPDVMEREGVTPTSGDYSYLESEPGEEWVSLLNS